MNATKFMKRLIVHHLMIMTLYSVVIYHYFSKVGSVSSGILHKLLKVSHKSHYFSWKWQSLVEKCKILLVMGNYSLKLLEIIL